MERDQFFKNKKALLVSMTAVLFFSSPAWSEIGDALVLCKHNKTVRTLRIEIDAEKKCRAIYTKQGVDETIGSGQYLNSCEAIVGGVRKNLEEAKWNCREVKEARSSSVNPQAE